MSAPASRIRTRLSAAPGATLALAALTLVTAFLAAALPRAVAAYETDGVRHQLRTADPDGRRLEAVLPGGRLTTAELARGRRVFRSLLREPLRADPAESSYGVRTDTIVAGDRWLPRLDLPTQLSLTAQAGLAEHARVVAGRLPRTGRVLEAAVTRATARTLRLRVGSALHFPLGERTLTVRVTGIVRPLRPRGDYWSAVPLLHTPEIRYAGPPPQAYRAGALLAAPGSGLALAALPGVQPEAYWQLSTDPSPLTAADVPGLVRQLASLEHGPQQAALRRRLDGDVRVRAPVGDSLAAYRRVRDATAPVTAVALCGLATLATVALLLTSGLTLSRRRPELTLLRARGASLPHLALGLAAESALVTVPTATAGCALALATVGSGAVTPAVASAAAVAAAATLGFPAYATVALRAGGPGAPRRGPRAGPVRTRAVVPRGGGGGSSSSGTEGSGEGGRSRSAAGGVKNRLPQRTGSARRIRPAPDRPARRSGSARRAAHARRAAPARRAGPAQRVAAELTLLVLALAAAATLHRRGTPDGKPDLLLSTAPTLTSLAAAVLLIRLYPVPLRLAARYSARRSRGAVGFLSLARSARLAGTHALPVLALLTALATAAIGASVTQGVAEARDRASALTTGADARIANSDPRFAARGGHLPASLARDARRAGGVRDVVPVWTETEVRAPGGTEVTLIAVDTRRYAPLVRKLGLAPFPTDALTRDAGSRALPAVSSLARGRDLSLRPLIGGLRVHVVASAPTTPAWPRGSFVLVDVHTLARTVPAADLRPKSLLVDARSADGSGLDTSALRAAAARAPAGTGVELRTEERAAQSGAPLQSGAAHLYAVSVAAGAGYALLALALGALHAAPGRLALLTRLRTMGLTPSQSRLLLLLESLPLALAATAGGTAAGLAAIHLLSPSIDLASVALPAQDPTPLLTAIRLRADPWTLAWPATGILLLATTAAATQAWWLGHRGISRELHVGHD